MPTGLPLRLSVSQSYALRQPGISYLSEGAVTDPRQLFVPQFQIIDGAADAFGSWQNGFWENVAPSQGPWAADIVVGSGQPAAVNPGVGTFVFYIRFQGSTETPAFSIGTIVFSNP